MIPWNIDNNFHSWKANLTTQHHTTTGTYQLPLLVTWYPPYPSIVLGSSGAESHEAGNNFLDQVRLTSSIRGSSILHSPFGLEKSTGLHASSMPAVKLFHLQTPFLANKQVLSRNFRESHFFLSRRCGYQLLGCWHALKWHANGICVNDPGTANGRCKAILRNIHQEPAEFHCFRCKDAGLWASMERTPNKSTPWISLNRVWGFSSTWLQCSTCVYSMLALGPQFT